MRTFTGGSRPDRSRMHGVSFQMDPRGPLRTFPSDTGDVADVSGQTTSLVRTGGAVWTKGQYGPSLSFNGSTSYAYSPGFFFPYFAPITVQYWQYVASAPTGGNSAFSIGSNGGSGNGRCQCHSPYSNGTLYWDYNDSNSGRLTTSYSAYYGKPTMVTLQAHPEYFQAIYLDAVLVAYQSSYDFLTASLNGLTIGAWTQDGFYFDGQIWGFKVLTRITSAAEIALDYADPFSVFRRRDRY